MTRKSFSQTQNTKTPSNQMSDAKVRKLDAEERKRLESKYRIGYENILNYIGNALFIVEKPASSQKLSVVLQKQYSIILESDDVKKAIENSFDWFKEILEVTNEGNYGIKKYHPNASIFFPKEDFPYIETKENHTRIKKK